jgi:hypothetical protein
MTTTQGEERVLDCVAEVGRMVGIARDPGGTVISHRDQHPAADAAIGAGGPDGLLALVDVHFASAPDSRTHTSDMTLRGMVMPAILQTCGPYP